MLWVRVPPELLEKTFVLVEQPGVLATLSRWRSRVQIPSGTLLTMARYANRQSGQAQTLVTAGSTPACATHEVNHPSAGHWRAQVAVNHPPSRMCRFNSCPTDLAIRPVRLSVQDGGLSSRRGGFDSRTGRSTNQYDQVVEPVDTRRSERRANTKRRGSSTLPLVTRNKMTQVSQCSAEFHKLSPPGVTPGPATWRRRGDGAAWPGTQSGKAARSRAS